MDRLKGRIKWREVRQREIREGIPRETAKIKGSLRQHNPQMIGEIEPQLAISSHQVQLPAP